MLLNNDTQVARGWVEGLRGAFADDSRTGAVGPRSNSVSGHQVVPEPGYRGAAQHRAAAERWRRAHRGHSTEVGRLVGFCLAVRRAALLEVGGLDEGYGAGGFEDDDLCLRLRSAGWTLRVAHEVLVHHEGSATFRGAGTWTASFAHALRHHRAKWGSSLGEGVLLSAALIVKDEQRALPRCLAALRGVVDEVVVCDTGSTDRTVEIAEAFGARVVHEPWTGSFAAARNAVLAHCRGTWVLSVDADEQLHVSPGTELRLTLLSTVHDAGTVTVRSRSDDEAAPSFEHAAGRLFRRGAVRWVGAVHESLVDERTGRPPVFATTPGLWLDHDGYVGRVYEARGKSTRNLLLAEKDHEQATAAGEARVWKTAYELARALSREPGDEARVEALVRQSLSLMPAGLAHLRCDALVRLCTALAGQGRLEDAEQAARDAVAVDPGDPASLLVLGQVLAHQRRYAEALAALDGPSASTGEVLRDLGKQEVDLPLLRARLLARLDRRVDAAAVLLALADTHLEAMDWPLLAQVLGSRTPELAAVAARAPEQALAALDGLGAPALAALHAELAHLGIDAVAHSPAVLHAARLDQVLDGHSGGGGAGDGGHRRRGGPRAVGAGAAGRGGAGRARPLPAAAGTQRRGRRRRRRARRAGARAGRAARGRGRGRSCRRRRHGECAARGGTAGQRAHAR